MLRALLLSIGDLGDRAVLRVFAKSLAVTMALFAGLGAALWWAIDALAGVDDLASAGITTLLALAGAGLALWVGFRAVGIAVIQALGDEVVAAVEARHYPAALAAVRPLGQLRAVRLGAASALRVTLWNLLALPVYLVLLVTGVGTAAAFLLLNGWLLGRDLGDMVASRHLDRAGAADWRRRSGGRRLLLGVAITALFLVPLLGLLAPILGAAAATHLFHGDRR